MKLKYKFVTTSLKIRNQFYLEYRPLLDVLKTSPRVLGSCDSSQPKINALGSFKWQPFSDLKLYNQLLSNMTHLTSCRFSLPGLSINKIAKITNGNKKQAGYRIALWNCGRGLLQNDGTGKLTEIQQFIESKQPHCFGIVESDLFSNNSQTNRKKYSTAEIEEKLKIDGYRIELPSTWYDHGQAQMICYVSDEIKYTKINLNDGNNHIPSITLLTLFSTDLIFRISVKRSLLPTVFNNLSFKLELTFLFARLTA